MPRIKYIEPDGREIEVTVTAGTSVMEGAVDNDVPGIVAECGGACSCATCHVYVEPAWLELLQPADAQEDGMLDCVLDRRPNSRLSCQVPVEEELDGITVRIPDAQL